MIPYLPVMCCTILTLARGLVVAQFVSLVTLTGKTSRSVHTHLLTVVS